MTGLVAPVVVVALRRIAQGRRAMLLVVVRHTHLLRVRSQLLLARHHGRRYPSQGQQHRQDHDDEDSQQLHGFETSTADAAGWWVADVPCSTGSGSPR